MIKFFRRIRQQLLSHLKETKGIRSWINQTLEQSDEETHKVLQLIEDELKNVD